MNRSTIRIAALLFPAATFVAVACGGDDAVTPATDAGTDTDSSVVVDAGPGKDAAQDAAPDAKPECVTGAECASKVCTAGKCVAAQCTDVIKNGAETDVDCGGTTCPKCADTKACAAASDCASGVCTAGVCAAPTCTDTVKNAKESDVDCGGDTCPKCADTKACAVAADCASGVCNAGVCKPAACDDTVKNGKETDVDCGGGTCAKCVDTKACTVAADCVSGVCNGNACAVPACNDTVKNGTETDVDCGGACATKCGAASACTVNADCGSNSCVNNKCALDVTFTPCGATLRVGPLQAACDAAYAGTELAGKVVVTAGIQKWTVPATATYRIEATGAQAGNHNFGPGGLGAKITGDFPLQAGDVVSILVGQRGQSGSAYDVGGGGGTFLSLGVVPMMVAAGGAGAGNCGGGFDAQVMAGRADLSAVGNGGTAGNDGNYCGCGGDGSAGGGFNTNGGGTGGSSFLNGGGGANTRRPGQCIDPGVGGFGGGGNGGNGGGGGGGFEGGNGGGAVGGAAGKGGKSYNQGLNPAGVTGTNAGAGSVRIRTLP